MRRRGNILYSTFICTAAEEASRGHSKLRLVLGITRPPSLAFPPTHGLDVLPSPCGPWLLNTGLHSGGFLWAVNISYLSFLSSLKKYLWFIYNAINSLTWKKKQDRAGREEHCNSTCSRLFLQAPPRPILIQVFLTLRWGSVLINRDGPEKPIISWKYREAENALPTPSLWIRAWPRLPETCLDTISKKLWQHSPL